VARPKRFSPREGLSRVARRLPLELKLPLLMSAILAVVLTIALVATYSTLRSAAIDRARDRVNRATHQIATVGASGLATQHARYLTVANDSVIRRALRGERVNVQPTLGRLSLPTDSGMPVELWSADGRRIGFIGNDVRTVMTVEPGRPELPARIARAFDEFAQRPDSLRLGPLYEEDGRVHFWFVMPVRDRGRVLGYITHQRRLAAGAQTAQTLRELAGDSVQIYYRNIDNSLTAGLGGAILAPYEGRDTAGGTARAADGSRVFIQEERIGSTPLMLGMTLPERPFLARAIRPVRKLALFSLLLLVGGGLAAWGIGRRIVGPLGRITRASEMLATGDFAARVPEEGDAEVRRLAQSFNHMAAEVDSSRRALERQTQEARAANNAKSEFLTTMSHELRTPLNAIGGYVDLLDLELRGPLTPTQKRDLERIKVSQQHLLGLISGVLDLARVEAGKVTYDMSNITLDVFLAGIGSLIEPQAGAKKVSFETLPVPADLGVFADREKLRQILLNLLSNAIRHTPPGGRVSVSAEALGGRVQVVVEDTGPGIPHDKREEIFEPFVQLDRSLAQPGEGLGLGLAISRDLARGMSGDLVVDPHSGPGARFVLTLNRGIADPSMEITMTGEIPVVPAGRRT
jgi:signal transduction histidine kinase